MCLVFPTKVQTRKTGLSASLSLPCQPPSSGPKRKFPVLAASRCNSFNNMPPSPLSQEMMDIINLQAWNSEMNVNREGIANQV